MNLLGTLLVLIVAAVAATTLAPIVVASLGLTLALGCLLIWLLPILIIVCSDKTCASEKLAWILAIIFLSWFAWIFYFLLAPIKGPPERRSYSSYRDEYY